MTPKEKAYDPGYISRDAAWDPCYAAIETLNEPLSRTEREVVMKKLRTALARFESGVLASQHCRTAVYTLFNAKLKAQHALSRLSRKFNMNIKGRSQSLSVHVSDTIREAFLAESHTPNVAPFLLKEVELSYSVLMGPEVLSALNLYAYPEWPYNVEQRALDDLILIRETQEQLFCSVVALAAELALKRSHHTQGDIITYEDLMQEALLAARDAVRSYQPMNYDDEAQAARAFTTYVFTVVHGTLAKFETSNSRTVRLPRKVIDRYVPIGEALEQGVAVSSYQDIAMLATKILHDKRQETKGKKLMRSEVYTAEEVFDLISSVQDISSLDVGVEDDGGELGGNDAAYLSLGDLIQNEGPLPDVDADRRGVNEKITRLFQEHCTSDDFLLMSLRWGMGEVVGMSEVKDLFHKATGRRTTRSKITAIEKELFRKMREDPRARELLEVFHG